MELPRCYFVCEVHMNAIAAGRAFTDRWSCRLGDILIWLRSPGLVQRVDDFCIVDFGFMRDGEHASISNQPVDLSDCFTLNPNEVSGGEALRMMARHSEGWRPGDPVDGPNAWRVCAGDRVVWIGVGAGSGVDESRVLTILDCGQSVLVAGVGRHDTLDEFLDFGSLPTEELTPQQAADMRGALKAAITRGASRTLATKWSIG